MNTTKETTDYYKARKTDGGDYGFQTPTGSVDGFQSMTSAQVMAERCEEQDRKVAEIGKGPLADVLRKHFTAEKAGKVGA